MEYYYQENCMCFLQTSEWYRFDDECVSKLDKKYLGEEEDEAMLGQKQLPMSRFCSVLIEYVLM